MLGRHASWKGSDQDGTHVLERGMGCVGEDERDAPSPCLDQVKALQQARIQSEEFQVPEPPTRISFDTYRRNSSLLVKHRYPA
jgi:hypothetical protein